MAKTNTRTNIPKNPDKLIVLSKAVTAKHLADGPNSPLAGLNMGELATKTALADTQNNMALKLRRDAELATQNRDLALGLEDPAKGTVTHTLRSVRDILAGLYKGNEQRLGDWGFEVDASPAPAKKTTPKPPV